MSIQDTPKRPLEGDFIERFEALRDQAAAEQYTDQASFLSVCLAKVKAMNRTFPILFGLSANQITCGLFLLIILGIIACVYYCRGKDGTPEENSGTTY